MELLTVVAMKKMNFVVCLVLPGLLTLVLISSSTTSPFPLDGFYCNTGLELTQAWFCEKEFNLEPVMCHRKTVVGQQRCVVCHGPGFVPTKPTPVKSRVKCGNRVSKSCVSTSVG